MNERAWLEELTERLSALDSLPSSEHVAAYEALHAELVATLATAGSLLSDSDSEG